MGLEELRALPLFDGLSDEQLDDLRRAGGEWSFGEGDELFREGLPAEVWWVLLEGSVTLSRRADTTVRSSAINRPAPGGEAPASPTPAPKRR